MATTKTYLIGAPDVTGVPPVPVAPPVPGVPPVAGVPPVPIAGVPPVPVAGVPPVPVAGVPPVPVAGVPPVAVAGAPPVAVVPPVAGAPPGAGVPPVLPVVPPVAGGVVLGGGVGDPVPPVAVEAEPPVPVAPPVAAGAFPPVPPVPAVSLELPAEPPVAAGGLFAPELEARGSTPASAPELEPASSDGPPAPAPAAQLIDREAASGSSVAAIRDRALLCLALERAMSRGTDGPRPSDVCTGGGGSTSEQVAQPGYLIVGRLQPDLHPLPLHPREGLRRGGPVGRRPEAGVPAVDLLHHGRVQLGQLQHGRPQPFRLGAGGRLLEQGEGLAAPRVLDHAVSRAVPVAREQAPERGQRVLAVIDHVPEDDAHPALRAEVEHAGLVDPRAQEAIALGGQIDHHAPVGLGPQGQDLVDAGEVGEIDRPGVVGVEADQRAVRPVGVCGRERELAIDAVLRAEARDHRLADAALLPPDEVDRAHAGSIRPGIFRAGGGDVSIRRRVSGRRGAPDRPRTGRSPSSTRASARSACARSDRRGRS